MTDSISFVYKGLLRKRGRTLLTLSGIAVGVASVIIIGAIGATGTVAVNHELDSLGMNGLSVMSKASTTVDTTLKTQDLELIRSLSCVEAATPIVANTSIASNGLHNCESVLWGIDSGSQSLISLEVLCGRELSHYDILSGANVCLIDQETARQFFQRDNPVGKSISLLVGETQEQYEIAGIVRANSGILQNLVSDYIPTLIYLPYTNVQKMTGSTEVTQIAVQVSDNASLDDAARQIEEGLSRSKGIPGAVRTDNLAKQRGQLTNMLSIVSLVLTAIAGISLVVAGLGITTVMLVSVHERTREIGIKKSIGATNWQIMKEFLLEASVISLAGSLVGALLGVGLCLLAGILTGMQLVIPPDQIVVSIISAVGVGVVFGVYPARKAAGLRPVEALRHE